MTLLVTRADVEQILHTDRDSVLEAFVTRMESAYLEVANATSEHHPSLYLRSKSDPTAGVLTSSGLYTSSGLLAGAGLMGTRLVALGPPAPYYGDQVLILFDQRERSLLAIVTDAVVHNYRSGAPAAVAARILANPAATSIGVLGSSGIAEGTLAMLLHVRPSVREVRVYSPTMEHRERFAAKMSAQFERDVRAVSSPTEAAGDADIIITATDARVPVVPDDAIGPGTFVAVMARDELEGATFRRSRIVLSSRPAYDMLDPPLREPLPEAAIVADLTDLLREKNDAGFAPEAVSVFYGVAHPDMCDVVAASVIFEAARKLQLGRSISLER